MTSLKSKQHGFTIVELLIVIVVIGILAGLVLNTFNGVQKKARDQERKTDINAVHGHLENYFANNGMYPTLAHMNDTTFRSANLKGLDADALKDPKGSSQALAATVSSTAYGYAVTPSGCDDDPATATVDCTDYTLEADLEDSATNYTKTDLNN